jgi:hypothetical protein
MAWSAAELASMLRHQLASPIRGDLEKVSAELTARYDQAATAPHESLGELLAAKNPSLDVLRVVKDFAKQSISRKDGALPEEIGAVLYYASISAALLRCGGERISGLDSQTLGEGLAWALGQQWLDKSLRELFDEARSQLKRT